MLYQTISIVYMKTHETKTPSRGFAITLVILPAVITIIILLIGNSVARAFSLAGAFQIIRFRSAPGNPKDITYVLFSMAVGLCCGMGCLVIGVIAAGGKRRKIRRYFQMKRIITLVTVVITKRKKSRER
jgi:ABC-type Fe3+ transport system permease subunit